jgi:hypothetical protein
VVDRRRDRRGARALGLAHPKSEALTLEEIGAGIGALLAASAVVALNQAANLQKVEAGAMQAANLRLRHGRTESGRRGGPGRPYSGE